MEWAGDQKLEIFRLMRIPKRHRLSVLRHFTVSRLLRRQSSLTASLRPLPASVVVVVGLPLRENASVIVNMQRPPRCNVTKLYRIGVPVMSMCASFSGFSDLLRLGGCSATKFQFTCYYPLIHNSNRRFQGSHGHWLCRQMSAVAFN